MRVGYAFQWVRYHQVLEKVWTRVCFSERVAEKWLRKIEAVEHIVGLLVPFSQRFNEGIQRGVLFGQYRK
jgi:hypothetical protein